MSAKEGLEEHGHRVRKALEEESERVGVSLKKRNPELELK